jgi:hypothetical protein
MLARTNVLEAGRRRKLTAFQPARSARVSPLTSADALRGRIPGRHRLLCVRACRGRRARNPRTGTDGEGVGGYADRPARFPASGAMKEQASAPGG